MQSKYRIFLRLVILLLLALDLLRAQTSSLHIRWDINPEPDMYQYHLYRAKNNSFNSSPFAVIIHPESLYCDTTDIAPGNLYSYTLAAIDSAGNQSDFSDTVSVGLPKIEWDTFTILNSETTRVDLSRIITDPDHLFPELEINLSNTNHLGYSHRGQNLLLYAQPPGYFGPASFNLTATDPDGFLDSVTISIEIENNLLTVISSSDETVPHTTILYSNYPNPFNATTQIYYALAQSGHLSLSLYNSLGEKVKTIQEGWYEVGFHRTPLDGSDLAAGIYYITMRMADYQKTIRLVLLK